MYEYIEGIIAKQTPTYTVIDVGGIAYKINVPLSTHEKIAGAKKIKLLIHLTIKEDAHILYGFFTTEEREIFKSLISVSGIGTNTAILILSSLATNELSEAIIKGDVALLKSIKGIGSKTAQRMIIELQDTFKKKTDEQIIGLNLPDSSFEEAIGALSMLGFKKHDAEKVVRKVVRENKAETLTVEEIIKLSLKRL
ncbi:MAG: Holliday junction branch migration protein RuvA [Bacteroidota bacterium]|nr:Holliday junction branch migration protein RuvA [Bacteroidota bacterium]